MTTSRPRAAARQVGTIIGIVALLALAGGGAAWGAAGDTTADLVLGQIDFFKFGMNLVDARSINFSTGVAIDTRVVPHRVYVADFSNNRVLRFPNAAAFVNGEPADLVLGQADLFSFLPNRGGAVNASGLDAPSGVAVDSSGNVFVADSFNTRVLEYRAPVANGQAAAVVLGQPNLTSNACVTSSTGLCQPIGVALDALGNIYVADDAASRIVMYTHGALTGAAAALIIGQPGPTSAGCGTSATTLCVPFGLAVDTKGSLWVADSDNDRVLRYSTIVNNAAADLVIGQPDFTTTSTCPPPTQQSLCRPQYVALDSAGNLFVSDNIHSRVTEYNTPVNNDPAFNEVFGQTSASARGCNSLGLGANSLCSPEGLALDGGALFVSDANNARVVSYSLPLLDTTADRVLGQHDFIHAKADMVKATGMLEPAAVAIDRSVIPNRLYMADSLDNRVLGYHSVAALVNGAPADLVIGQPDFFSYYCNQNPKPHAPVDADTLCNPSAIAVDPKGNLYVADTVNNRVLEYDIPFTTDTIADRVYGQAGNFFSAECNDSDGPNADTLCEPQGVAIDPAGNLYISDSNNNRVVEYNTPLTNSHGNLIFGQFGNFGISLCNAGLSGPTADTLCAPAGLAIDAAADL
ncbi:MAG TPA: NHL repeat-containing protein [Candidatus Binataceae bacterium]|jgi:sugar lactone lactonase YvrE|nr:NHL repeat-containing protein [Candidatus Binataceae bacterium]